MIASFDSKCPGCNGDIYEGDDIYRDIGDMFVCEGCKPAKRRPIFNGRLKPKDPNTPSAEGILRQAIGKIDGLTEEYPTSARDWQEAAALIEAWAIARGAK